MKYDIIVRFRGYDKAGNEILDLSEVDMRFDLYFWIEMTYEQHRNSIDHFTDISIFLWECKSLTLHRLLAF